ncbi:hypothetical protein PATSB16_29630 [Pandoraea thiooxydans]|nr:hypothetical protein PATSB16_29630 [Pandoraea thiooxydans]
MDSWRTQSKRGYEAACAKLLAAHRAFVLFMIAGGAAAR